MFAGKLKLDEQSKGVKNIPVISFLITIIILLRTDKWEDLLKNNEPQRRLLSELDDIGQLFLPQEQLRSKRCCIRLQNYIFNKNIVESDVNPLDAIEMVIIVFLIFTFKSHF